MRLRETHFDKGYGLLNFEKNEQRTFSAVILENQADVQILLKNYPEAKRLLELSISTVIQYSRDNKYDKSIPSFASLIKIKKELGEYGSLKPLVDEFFKHLAKYQNKEKRYE